MAITFVDSSWQSLSSSSTTAVVPAHAAGDVGVLFIGLSTQFLTGIAIDQGWTKLSGDDNTVFASGGGVNNAVFYKVLTGAETNPTITFNGGANWNNPLMHVYRGVDQTTPIDVASVFGITDTSATPNAPDITTVTANAALLTYWYNANYESQPTPPPTPAGFILVDQVEDYDTSAYLLDAGAAGLKTLGNWSFVSMNAACDSAMYTVALRPAVGAPPAGTSLYLGSTEHNKVYLGGTPIVAIYLGSTKTFEA